MTNDTKFEVFDKETNDKVVEIYMRKSKQAKERRNLSNIHKGRTE